MGELIYRIKNNFEFNNNELKEIIISSLIIGSIFALRLWSKATIGDLILGIVIALTSIFFHVSFQKIVGLKIGYSTEFKICWHGLGIAAILAIISQGWFWWLIVPGSVVFSIIPKYRLGRFRYGLSYFQTGLIAFSGAIGSIIFGTIFKNIELYMSFFQISSSLLNSFFIFNLAYAAVSLLPIPPLDGHYLFYGSRNWYVILASTIIAYAILTALSFYSWIIAIVIGLFAWVVYYSFFERKV